MKSDIQIQKDVIAEIKWDPFLSVSEIGVSVKNGIVTLSGHVDTFAKKVAAEKAAKRVAGVKVVAEDIQVGISPDFRKTDTEIAEAILNALKWHAAIHQDKIKIKVEDGAVTVEGSVEWEYQRNNVSFAIENLAGVRSVNNLIKIKPSLSAADIQQKISNAFHRNATINAAKILISINGTKVVLRGKVGTFSEKEEAEREAWAAPGVTSVENKLEVSIPEYAYEE